MTTPPGVAHTTLEFSTDPFPARERVSAWVEIFGRGFAKLDVLPMQDIPFYARMSMRVIPDLAIVSGSGAVKDVGRSRSLVADGNDSVVLQIASCAGVTFQLGREIAVPAGDAIALSNANVGHFTFAGEQSVLALNVPRIALKSALRDPDDVFTRTVRKDNEALQLLRSYVSAIESQPALIHPQVQRLAAAHVHDLMALALGATRDAAEIARTRGVRAARLHVAKALVANHVGHAELSAATVAAHLGVTPRYVHMLFETEGVSFAEFVLSERLERAYRMLRAPRYLGDAISTIAYSVGFTNLSHFNRSFRRRYGGTPSDVRAAHIRDGAI